MEWCLPWLLTAGFGSELSHCELVSITVHCSHRYLVHRARSASFAALGSTEQCKPLALLIQDGRATSIDQSRNPLFNGIDGGWCISRGVKPRGSGAFECW